MTTSEIDPKNPATTVAEAHAAGYTHVGVVCSSCGYIVAVPFRMIRRPSGSATLERLATRLKCERCGGLPEPGSVKFWRQSDAPGYAQRPCW